jgi:hypothetical protein
MGRSRIPEAESKRWNGGASSKNLSLWQVDITLWGFWEGILPALLLSCHQYQVSSTLETTNICSLLFCNDRVHSFVETPRVGNFGVDRAKAENRRNTFFR